MSTPNRFLELLIQHKEIFDSSQGSIDRVNELGKYFKINNYPIKIVKYCWNVIAFEFSGQLYPMNDIQFRSLIDKMIDLLFPADVINWLLEKSSSYLRVIPIRRTTLAGGVQSYSTTRVIELK